MVTARQIATETRMGIESLIGKDGVKVNVFRSVAKSAGVSLSLVTKFYCGTKSNPSVDTLDKLTAAVDYLNMDRRVKEFKG
jgi:transcriptional regulator with XRE-family HTH domain